VKRTAEITFRARTVQDTEKMRRKLSWRDSWRDPRTGEMNEIIYEGEGGEIAFYYDHKSKRMVPYTIDAYKNASRSTYPEIKEFVRRLPFDCEIVNDIPETEVTIAVDEKQLGEEFETTVADLEQLLYGARFCTHDTVIIET